VSGDEFAADGPVQGRVRVLSEARSIGRRRIELLTGINGANQLPKLIGGVKVQIGIEVSDETLNHAT
jgi:hypothetical protein